MGKVDGESRRRRANGEGSIYQRTSDGLWVGSAFVYTTSGTRKRKLVYGHSFNEVREKLDKLKGNSVSGIAVPERSSTVAEYLAYWLNDVAITKRATTRRGYESAVRLHIVPVLGKKKLDKLAVKDVKHLLAVCRAKCLCCANGYDERRDVESQCCSIGKCCERYPSKRQIQYIRDVLRNALSCAEREEIIVRNVAKLVSVPAPRYKIGKGLPVSDVKKILREAMKSSRLYALYVLAATLGMRRGELLGLRWIDLDLDKGTLTPAKTVQRVNGQLLIEDTKSEESDNTIPLPKITLRVLKEHRQRQNEEIDEMGELWVDHGFVFPTSVGTPMEPRSLNRHFERLRDRVGLSDVRLHDMRHTVVTLLLELGTSPHVVQAIARHADLEVTLGIYAHTNLDAMRDALDKIDWEQD